MSWRFWRRSDRDFAAEIEAHLDAETRRLVDSGLTEAEARMAARRDFGNVTTARERFHESRRLTWIEDLGADLHFALRTLRKNPVFATAAILSLALGIGANTAIFSLVDAMLLRRLPVNAPQALRYLRRDVPNPLGGLNGFWIHPDVAAYQHLDVFAGVAGIVTVTRANVRLGGPQPKIDPTPVRVDLVSGAYFTTLGTRAGRGRLFTDADDRVPGGHPLAVISDAYWARAFARDPDVLGRSIAFNGITFTIIGVAAPGFTGDWVGKLTDVWIPMAMYAPVRSVPLGDQFSADRVIVRLRPDVSPVTAQAALDVTAPPLARAYLDANPQSPDWAVKQLQLRVVLSPGDRGYSPQRVSLTQPLSILMVMVGLVLLIAAANVANLLLARATARVPELSLRRALGAGTGRLVRQLLAEGLLLSGLGALLGIAVALWGARFLLGFVHSAAAGSVGAAAAIGLGSVRLTVGVDMRFLAFAGALGVLAGVLFGLAPAALARAASPSASLGQRGTGGTTGRLPLARALVVVQVAFSLVLVIGAGILVRSLHRLRNQDLGLDRDRVLLVWAEPGLTGRTPPQLVALADAVDLRLAGVPGVVGAAATSTGLLNGVDGTLFGSSNSVNLEGREPQAGLHTARSVVTPGFFHAAGIPLLAGRDFGAWDSAGAPLVVIVNEAFARLAFGGLDALGKHIGWLGDQGTPRQIVGIARDAKHNTLRDQEMGFIYIPYRQRPAELNSMCIVVRTAGEPRALIDTIRGTLAALDPGLPVIGVETVSDQMDVTLIRERLAALLGEGFGALAAVLAALGLYAVVAYAVARRTNEFGVRLALGARPLQIVGMVLKDSLTLVVMGIGLGVAGSALATRLIASQLFGVGALDPVTIAGAVVAMLIVASAACLIPAGRATRVDPILALRCE